MRCRSAFSPRPLLPPRVSDGVIPVEDVIDQAFELRDSKYDWAFKTGMIDRPEYTRIEKPNTRGKALGGSSCLNYYTWILGSVATFDDWAAFGGDEWT